MSAKHYKTLATAFVFFTMIAPTPVIAQANTLPPLPTDTASRDSRLGPWLEFQFQKMFDTCYRTTGGLKLLKSGKPDKKRHYISISSIPHEIVINKRLSETSLGPAIRTTDGRDVSNYLGYIFIDNNITDLTFGDTNHYLYNNIAALGRVITVPGVSSLSTSYSCNTVAAAKLSIDGGYTLPFASVSGALSAESEGSNAYSLQLLSTEFSSPVHLAYQGIPTNGIDTFFASILFLDWYARNPGRIGKTNKYIANLTGYAVTQELNGKHKKRIDAQASASAGFLSFASAETSAQYTKEFFTAIQLTEFKVAIERDRDRLLKLVKADLPTVDAIMSNISSSPIMDSISDDERDFILYSHAPVTTKAKLRGVTPKLCSSAFWKPVSVPSEKIDMVLSSFTRSSDANGVPFCEIHITLSPAANFDLRLSHPLSLKLKLMAPQATPTSAAITPAQVLIGKVTLNGNFKPVLSFGSVPKEPRVPGGVVTQGGASHSILTWDWRIAIDDDNMLQNNNQVDTSSLHFDCGEGTPLDQKPSIISSLNRVNDRRSELQLLMTYRYDGDYEADRASLAHNTCHWEGNINFTIGSEIVPRSMTSRPLLVPDPAGNAVGG